MNNEFKIGDTIKICNVGFIYPRYDSLAEKFGMKNWEKGNHYLYDKSRITSDPDPYIIINIDDSKYYIIFYIRNMKNEKEYLVDTRGIEPYEEFITEKEFSV